jgi:plastocyanin domain-containing protein
VEIDKLAVTVSGLAMIGLVLWFFFGSSRGR